MRSADVKRKRLLAALSCFAAAVIFGFGFVVVKDSIDSLPAVYLVALRATTATLFLCVVFFKKLLLITKKAVLQGFLLGASFGGGYILQSIGLSYTTAGKSAFLTSVYIVITPVFAFILLKKRMDLYTLAAALLGFVGMGFISLGSEGGFNVGDVVTVISGIGFSLQIVIMERSMRDSDPALLTLLMFFFVAAIAWVCAPFLHGPLKAEMLSKSAVLSLVYLGVVASGLALLLQTWGQRYLSSSQTSLILGFEAVFGALFGIIFLSEALTLKMAVGCVLMLLALVVSETKLDFLRRWIISCRDRKRLSVRASQKPENGFTESDENEAEEQASEGVPCDRVNADDADDIR